MLIPVILSGGVGARLWPVSRESYPKPFIRLHDGLSLIQKTFLRVAEFPDLEEIVVVTNREHYFQTLDQFSELDMSRHLSLQFLLEPFGRNTAPAIAMAAHYIAKKYGDDAQMLVLPADHIIDQQQNFAQAVCAAQHLAERGLLVTFGLKPHSADTGFGYIEAGSKIANVQTSGNNSVYAVKSFAEKPTQQVAEAYLSSGRYLWNAGIFCFTAGAFLTTLQQTAPEVDLEVANCWQRSTRANGPVQIVPECFQAVPDISVDYAVMEKADNVAVVCCAMGWSDVGSWTALSGQTPADADGNRIEGEALPIDSHNCYIRSEDRLIATIGVDDLIIVDTSDALLVADKNKAQDVKKIVKQLKLADHPCYRTHNTVHRPWGTYTELEHGDRFKIKRIVVKPGASLSLQMHYHRCEHWVVVRGTAHIINGEKENILKVNESTFIPAGHRHRLKNPGKVPLVLIEVQSGEYLEEDDIVRYGDIYGRAEGEEN